METGRAEPGNKAGMFRLVHDGPIARLSLDRTGSRNAIPVAGWADLDSLVARVGSSDARLLVLSGADRAFCAGADLRDFAAMAGDETAAGRFRIDMRAALHRLANLAIPTIAWIEGPCFGAGVALALACDIRLAGAHAVFAVPPAKIGLSYPQEDVHRLVATVGAASAARLLFSGTPIDAVEAARIGLADRAEAADLEALIRAIAGNVPESLFALKQALRLARLDVCQDALQDKVFDALASAEQLSARISAR